MLALQEPSATPNRYRTDWDIAMSGPSYIGDEYKLPDVSTFQIKRESFGAADPSSDCDERGGGGGRGGLRLAPQPPQYSPFDAYAVGDCKPSFAPLGGSMDTPAVERLVMEQIQHDISSCARSLCIATNPELWSVSDARKWLAWMVESYRLPRIADCLAFDGPSLCSFSEEELTLLCGSPEVGSKVAAQLEVWKNACKIQGQLPFSFFPIISPTEATCQYRLPVPTADSAASGGLLSPCLSPSSATAHSPYSSCSDMSQSSCDGMSSHDESSEDCCMVGGQPSPRFGRQPVHLWEFLKELLLAGEEDCIQWIDKPKGIFRIHDSARVAKLWGQRKNRPAMNYDKLSRSIRQYYKKGIIKKTAQSKRLVYQFCEPYLSR